MKRYKQHKLSTSYGKIKKEKQVNTARGQVRIDMRRTLSTSQLSPGITALFFDELYIHFDALNG